MEILKIHDNLRFNRLRFVRWLLKPDNQEYIIRCGEAKENILKNHQAYVKEEEGF